MPERPVHETVPVLVWADVDRGVADLVAQLNAIPGVRTHASCQGTLDEGGPHPYRPYVLCSWTAEAFARLTAEFEVEVQGKAHGAVHARLPKDAARG